MPEETKTKSTTKKASITAKSEVKKTKTTATKTKISEVKEKKASKASAKEFQGKYIQALGRRKKSVAQVRLYPKGSGLIMVNGKKINEYFDEDRIYFVTQALKLTSHQKDLDFSILVKGGGAQGQAEASSLGISRALIEHDTDLTLALKAKGYTTRDPRRKERKKPGLKKARRAPQWSKR